MARVIAFVVPTIYLTTYCVMVAASALVPQVRLALSLVGAAAPSVLFLLPLQVSAHQKVVATSIYAVSTYVGFAVGFIAAIAFAAAGGALVLLGMAIGIVSGVLVATSIASVPVWLSELAFAPGDRIGRRRHWWGITLSGLATGGLYLMSGPTVAYPSLALAVLAFAPHYLAIQGAAGISGDGPAR